MALLITEVFNEDCSVLIEANENGKKSYYIEGNFMQADIKNRNGRVYPSAILEKEMDRYNEQFIKTRRALGELGHPDGPQINGDRVSHLIVEMTRDKTNFVGKAKIIGTPMGEIVKTFIDEGVKIGVSTRGMGSVKTTKEGIMEVQSDFHLATVDIVTDPSGPNCFVNGIMENTEYYFDIASSSWIPGGVKELSEVAEQLANPDYEIAMRKLQQLEEMVADMKKTKKPQLNESNALKMFETFVSTLKSYK
jgi:hypothetical protein